MAKRTRYLTDTNSPEGVYFYLSEHPQGSRHIIASRDAGKSEKVSGVVFAAEKGSSQDVGTVSNRWDMRKLTRIEEPRFPLPELVPHYRALFSADFPLAGIPTTYCVTDGFFRSEEDVIVFLQRLEHTNIRIIQFPYVDNDHTPTLMLPKLGDK